MQETEDNSKPSYDVIQFLELPNENIEKYSVIPHSWIRIILPTEGTVTVAYPEEDEGKTYKRVKNKKKFKKHWKRYPAVVKYEAYTFEEAQCWKSVATLGNSNIYDHVIETKMDHYGNCSDADNSIEDDYTDDDCIILTKEEPLDIHDNFADVVSQLNGENVDNGNASMNDDEQLDFEESFSAAENLIAPLIDDLEDNVTLPINDEQIGYNESFSAADNLIASVTDDLEDNVTSPINDEQIRYNENFSAAENLIAPLTDDLKDNVTSPINDEQIGYNDDYDDADSFVPQINTDEAGTSIAHTDENNKDDCVAPIHKNDTNKHAAISNNNYADNFFTPKHNNDDVHVIPVRGNSANDCVTPTNNTDIDNCAAVNNCIYDCVTPVHNNKAFDYIALEHNNNTDDCVSSGHNDNAINCVAPKSNICTNCDAAPNNCNHKSDNVAPSNDNDSGDHGGNNHIAPMSNDENTYKNDSPQSMLNAAATTSTTNNLIQTGRPRSVFLEPSKSIPKKTRTTMCCDYPPPNTITKPQMTVMPRINIQNELAPSKSVIECTKKKQLIYNDKEISNRVKFINHLINSNMNSKEKETYPILQDNSLQPLNLEKNVTSRVNNACHQQAYPQGLSNSANMSFNPSENRNSFQKHTSRVSVNDWAQDHINPSFLSPSVESTRKMTYFNSIQDNMTSANENCRPIQPEAVNKQPVTLLENGLRAESVRPNLAHNIVTQMNHIDQTPYSQNATNTASTQHLTKYPTYGNFNSGQQMTSALANEHFALAKRKFSLASVQHSELYRHDYNNLPVTLHENDSSMEPIRAKIIDYSVNQKNRLDEKAHSSNVKNTATIEYSTHRNLNSGQQMTSTNVILRHANELPKYSTHSTVQPTTMHEPPQSNNPISTHRKKTQRNSPKQSQQNSSNYTFSVQPAQIIISDSTGQVPQNIANNQPSPLQNSFSAASQHWIPHAAQRHMPYEPRATQIPVGKPMESNSIYSQYGIQHNMMGQPSVMRNPGHSNTNMQVSPFIRPLNSNLFAHNTPTIFTNSSQGLHRKGGGTHNQDYTQGAISTIADSMYRGPCLEGYVNTGAHAVPNFVNRAVPYSEHTSIDRAHVIQDTNGLIFTKPPNAYPFEQRTSIQSTSMNNIPLGFQQYPAANQLNQYSGRFNEQRTAPVYENNLIHETHMQNTNTKRPAAVNTHSFNPQSYHQYKKYSQSIESLVQTNQYHCANKCCNPNVVQSTVVQNHPQLKQNVEFSTENALNSTNQSALEENQLATQQQNSSSRKQHNCTEPGNCETNDTANQQEIKINKNSSDMMQSLINQAKAYKKIHVNSSDERMSTEFNTIEQSNNTKECDPKHSKNRQSYEKTDRISSISSNSSDEEISINEITVEKINNAKNKVHSIEPKNSNCLLDDCTQQSRVLDRRTSLKEIKTHLKKMKSRSSKTYSIFQTRFDSYTGDIDIWKKLKERINVYVDRKIKESSSKLQIQNKNKGEVQNLCLYNDQSSGDDSDDDSDYYQEPPQKKPFLQKKSIQMTQSGY